ncbi:hypothetical protein [Halalkalibacter nanhaiisediminis]|uniref:Uncharacterized protein n=1 Tax=Halalkalibacter nanhaiisediminis TaxID=688079 RepID=A0A562QAU2_9BACI|nr:hypothetical protein [Halalkalibacter nanhaiisediminis]TWI53290.1 hypothetical protein IQ10_03424 [Halalkalibacter nanhaiisediminis]
MKYLKLICGILSMIISFYLYILAIMNMFPLFIAAPLLLLSIVFTLSPLSSYKRFKGF